MIELRGVKDSKLTKTAFAEKINVSQSFISRLVSGEKVPSDRTIADICREFNISELWLRTGEGEPHIQKDEGRRVPLKLWNGFICQTMI